MHATLRSHDARCASRALVDMRQSIAVGRTSSTSRSSHTSQVRAETRGVGDECAAAQRRRLPQRSSGPRSRRGDRGRATRCAARRSGAATCRSRSGDTSPSTTRRARARSASTPRGRRGRGTGARARARTRPRPRPRAAHLRDVAAAAARPGAQLAGVRATTSKRDHDAPRIDASLRGRRDEAHGSSRDRHVRRHAELRPRVAVDVSLTTDSVPTGASTPRRASTLGVPRAVRLECVERIGRRRARRAPTRASRARSRTCDDVRARRRRRPSPSSLRERGEEHARSRGPRTRRESDPWIRFSVSSVARSPRIVPGAASAGLVAPIGRRGRSPRCPRGPPRRRRRPGTG